MTRGADKAEIYIRCAYVAKRRGAATWELIKSSSDTKAVERLKELKASISDFFFEKEGYRDIPSDITLESAVNLVEELRLKGFQEVGMELQESENHWWRWPLKTGVQLAAYVGISMGAMLASMPLSYLLKTPYFSQNWIHVWNWGPGRFFLVVTSAGVAGYFAVEKIFDDHEVGEIESYFCSLTLVSEHD